MRAILTYHSVDDSGSAVSVTPQAFEAHVRWLSSGRVKVLSLDELLAQPADGNAVAVTFDDAFLSARPAVERLLDAGVPATIFVATGHVGGTNAWNGQPDAGIPIAPLMGWQDLEDLRARGAEMAPHTRRHRRLTAVTDGQLDEELLGSLDDLQQRLGTASPHFAYPYGDVDDRVARRTARHFQWAHTADFRPLSAEDSPHRLPRLDMYYFKQPGALDSWGTQRFRHRLAVTRARRWVRAQVVG